MQPKQKPKRSGFFDFLNSISYTKKDLLEDDEYDIKDYNPFMINRWLIHYGDTIFLANEMNMRFHMDPEYQYRYLMAIVRKRKRFSSWVKKEKDDDLEFIMDYYGFSHSKAVSAQNILSSEQIEQLKNKGNRGGRFGKTIRKERNG